MKYGVIQIFYFYWDNFCGNWFVLNCSEIDLGEICGFLGDIFILEINGQMDVCYCFVGMCLCLVYCWELKGCNFLCGWSVKDWEVFESLIVVIFEDVVVVVIGINGYIEWDQIFLMEMLLVLLNVFGEGWIWIFGSVMLMEKLYWVGFYFILKQLISSLCLVWLDECFYFDDVKVMFNLILFCFIVEGMFVVVYFLLFGVEC